MLPVYTRAGVVAAVLASSTVALVIGLALGGGALSSLEKWQALVGAMIALCAALIAARIAWQNVTRTLTHSAKQETKKREQTAQDVATIVHAELAHLVARCCFDSEQPWRDYWPRNSKADPWFPDRIKKFMPAKPAIYLGNVGQLALLGDTASQRLIEFQYRLAALTREIENVTSSLAATSKAKPDEMRLIALRFYQTLKPGLDALEALGGVIEGAEAKEAIAFRSYYESRGATLGDTLRSHIRALLPSAPPEAKTGRDTSLSDQRVQVPPPKD